MQVTPFLFLLLREAGAARGNCLDSNGNRGGFTPQDRPLGEGMAPWEAAAKLLAASLEASFGLCHPSVPQEMAMFKALCGLENGLSFLHGFSVVCLCIERFYFLHRHTQEL